MDISLLDLFGCELLNSEFSSGAIYGINESELTSLLVGLASIQHFRMPMHIKYDKKRLIALFLTQIKRIFNL